MAEDMTFSEAKAHAAVILAALEKQKIPRYSVSNAGAEQYECIETLPPHYVAKGVHVLVDVPSSDCTDGKHYIPACSSWGDPEFLLLCCGLVRRVPKAWRQRIAFWKWEEPALWQTERAAWRRGKPVTVDANTRDEECQSIAKHATLKRKLAAIESAFAKANKPRKRQRTDKTDEEVLAERRASEHVALPSGDSDDI